MGKRFSDCCKRGGFAGAGKGLNLQRRAHVQITRGLANSVLFVGKIHQTTLPIAIIPELFIRTTGELPRLIGRDWFCDSSLESLCAGTRKAVGSGLRHSTLDVRDRVGPERCMRGPARSAVDRTQGSGRSHSLRTRLLHASLGRGASHRFFWLGVASMRLEELRECPAVVSTRDKEAPRSPRALVGKGGYASWRKVGQPSSATAAH